MKRNPYWPPRQAAQIVWLATFINRLPDNAAALGLTPDQVNAILADCLWLLYVLQTWLPAVRNFNTAATNATTATQTGAGADAQVLPVFTPPVLPATVAAVPPGVLTRLFAAIQIIKDSGKCTATIAADLGIVGTAQPGPDLTTIRPSSPPTSKAPRSSLNGAGAATPPFWTPAKSGWTVATARALCS